MKNQDHDAFPYNASKKVYNFALLFCSHRRWNDCRCIGMLLQKVDNRAYVQQKIAAMYKHADLADETNRLGLAKGMGLVATLSPLY